MAFRLGGNNINKLYLNNNEIKKVYYNNTSVYDKTSTVSLPSGMEFNFIINDPNSYNNATAPQDVLNTVTSPNSGASQTDYDHVFGDTNASSTDDPSYVNASPDYASLDGGDFIRMESGTSFTNNLHKSGGAGVPWTMIMAARFRGTINQVLWGTAGATATHGIQLFLTNDANGLRLFKTYGVGGQVEEASLDSFADIATDTDRLIVVTFDPFNSNWQFWNNSKTRTSSGSMSTVATTVNPPGRLTWGTRGGGGAPMVNGSRIYGGGMMNKVATQAEVEQLIDYYNQELGWNIS